MSQASTSSAVMGFVKNSFKRVGKFAKTSLAVVGFITVVALAVESRDTIKSLKQEVDDVDGDNKKEGKKKKRVLVIPFHNLKLVTKSDGFAWLRNRSDNDPVIEMETNQLVTLIHEAAQDPNIVALFGKFGHARGFSGGLADAEEIRNGTLGTVCKL